MLTSMKKLLTQPWQSSHLRQAAIKSCQASRYRAHITGLYRQQPAGTQSLAPRESQGTRTAPTTHPTAVTKFTLAPVVNSLWYMLNALWKLSHPVSVDLTPLYMLLLPHKSRRAPTPNPAGEVEVDLLRHPLPSWAPQGTHPSPQRLWNQTTATPQVSLPGILGMIKLMSTIMQYVHPQIHHTHWSIPQSSPFCGLQWLLALHDKAIASAWDLVTQTHLGCRVH